MKRGSLVYSQTATPEYSALVPIILAGLKKYKNIRYEEWSPLGLRHLMDSQLYDAATYQMPNLSIDEIMAIRTTGLTTMTGSKAGTLKKATSTWRLTNIKNTLVADAPFLATTMLTQIWVAHPSIRNSMMILDPKAWDNMPKPLIETSVLVDDTKINISTELPW
jgi:hypothetical protein